MNLPAIPQGVEPTFEAIAVEIVRRGGDVDLSSDHYGLWRLHLRLPMSPRLLTPPGPEFDVILDGRGATPTAALFDAMRNATKGWFEVEAWIDAYDRDLGI